MLETLTLNHDKDRTPITTEPQHMHARKKFVETHTHTHTHTHTLAQPHCTLSLVVKGNSWGLMQHYSRFEPVSCFQCLNSIESRILSNPTYLVLSA
jgi:hypothetical protein